MINNRLKIGEFSRLCRVTVRTLRHYEQIGLLVPEIVDLFAWIKKEGYKVVGEPRSNYIDGIWNQEDSDMWLTIIQVPVEKN